MEAMPDPTLTSLLTIYGPLGLGWVVAALLWRRYEKRIDADAENIQRETEAKLKLAEALKQLEGTVNAIAAKVS